MKILVIRFRQMGDAILATSLCNTLHHNFPDAEIHFVLNQRIAPLFEGHPAIHRIITFTDDERHSLPTYLRKVWNIVHQTHYDVIIDMRSTLNTLPFALFSHSSRYRIGQKKAYTYPVFNYRVTHGKHEDMLSRNLRLLQPLNGIKHIEPVRTFSLSITHEEKQAFRSYMEQCGINFAQPIMLVGVTAKLADKTWKEENMVWVLRKFSEEYPDTQIVFNYAPGQEADNARRIYEAVGNKNVFIDLQARSSRELAAMASLITFYFGNEGGARHIVHAMGKPSLVICSPKADKQVWIPRNEVLAEAIDTADVLQDAKKIALMEYQECYDAITKEYVWERLLHFCQQLAI